MAVMVFVDSARATSSCSCSFWPSATTARCVRVSSVLMATSERNVVIERGVTGLLRGCGRRRRGLNRRLRDDLRRAQAQATHDLAAEAHIRIDEDLHLVADPVI